MKYSPSPWIAKFEEAFRIKDIKGNTVCIMTHLTKTGRRESSEVEANAKLIAAAPELLRVLEEISTHFDESSVIGEIIYAALEKARTE